jgi:hypothetical protein
MTRGVPVQEGEVAAELGGNTRDEAKDTKRAQEPEYVQPGSNKYKAGRYGIDDRIEYRKAEWKMKTGYRTVEIEWS